MMIARTSVIIGAVLLAVAGLAVLTAAQEEDLASVSAALAPRAEGLIVARCSVCHSPDLVSQQRLPKDRWLATVDKMKHWGAEITDDEAELLVRYLSARYNPAAPDHLPPLDSELRKAEPLTQEPADAGPLVGVATRGQASSSIIVRPVMAPARPVAWGRSWRRIRS